MLKWGGEDISYPHFGYTATVACRKHLRGSSSKPLLNKVIGGGCTKVQVYTMRSVVWNISSEIRCNGVDLGHEIGKCGSIDFLGAISATKETTSGC